MINPVKKIQLSKKNPNRIAIRYKEEYITYFELLTKIFLISNYICQKKKYTIETPIIIYMNRKIEFILLMLPVMASGCYYIPLEMSILKGRIVQIIYDSQSKLIISCNNFDTGKIIEVINIKNIEEKR